MKKLFASLLAATMVAGMAVSAFAYTDHANNAEGTATAITTVYDDSDFTFAVTAGQTVYKSDDKTDPDGYIEPLNGNKVSGGKLYYPILVSEAELKDNGTATDYFYATKPSEVSSLRARVGATIGKEYVEKDANIVLKKIQDSNKDGATSKKVYCVEVKLSDFNFTVEKEIEFDLSLYNKGRKQATTKDDDTNTTITRKFVYGSDSKYINLADSVEGPRFESTTASSAIAGVYKVKFSKNELSMSVLPGATAIQLEKAREKSNKEEDIEVINLDFVKADATFEVAATKQDDLYLGYSTDANKDLVLANPDADVTFLDFDAAPQFDFKGTLKLTFEDPDKTYFCYELKDGVVTAVGTYNAEDECFDIKTSQLTSYVLSDKELVSVTKAEEEKPAVEAPVENDKVVGTGAIA